MVTGNDARHLAQRNKQTQAYCVIVPQRGGAGNKTFMCKGCTLRIDTWYQATASQGKTLSGWSSLNLKPGTLTSFIEVTQSNHCDLMYTNTAVDLNYSRRGQRNSSQL